MARDEQAGLPEQLTSREREVLELLRLGLTNEEIAERLGISLAGARYHVSEIIGKLGVRTRYEAAAWPERRPWWMATLAPIAWLRRGSSFTWLSPVLAGVLALVVAGGVAVLVWGLVRAQGGEDEEPRIAGSETPGAPTPIDTRADGTPVATATPLEEPIDPALCDLPVGSGNWRRGGAFETASFPSIELHTDIAEAIVTGTIVRRDVDLTQAWSVPSDEVVVGEPREPSYPLPVVFCTGLYTVDVSSVLKNDGGGEIPNRIDVHAHEREAYFEEGNAVEIVPPLSPGQDVVLLLFRLGETGSYTGIGPRIVADDTGLHAVGRYTGYVNMLGDMSLEEFLSAIRARAAEVPYARPFPDVLDDMMTPSPAP